MNDAPVLSNIAVIGIQEGKLSFSVSQFAEAFSDFEEDPLTKVQITRLPENGLLRVGSEAVVLNQEISVDELDNLTFEPTPGFVGATSFEWNGSDGTEYASSSALANIEVIVQQPPTLTQLNISLPEDGELVFSATDFSSQFSDADGDELVKIQITTLPSQGTLYWNGVAVEVNTEIMATDIAQLTFVPEADFYGTTSFRWNGSDGFQYAENDATVELIVTAVPDIPEVEAVMITGLEDSTLALGVAHFSSQFRDADADALSAVRIVRLPDQGILYLDGVAIREGDEIPADQLDLLTFEPPADFYGTIRFEWNGSDGTTYAAELAEVVLTLQPTPDGVPVASTVTVTTATDEAVSGSLVEYVTDPEGTGLRFLLELVTTPQHGTLSVNEEGAFTYTPEAGYYGADSAVYQVCDRSTPAQCAFGTLVIRIVGGSEDSDEDGIPDEVEIGEDTDHPRDSDGDGTPDFQDTDSDNDGIPDAVEAGPTPHQPTDSDGDGVPDFRETDSDGDGLTDAVEAGADPQHPIDSDGDGIPDFQDPDSNDDGTPDGEDDGLVIYEGFSPNADGRNEAWVIEGIERYPNNTVQIYNRWGNKIHEIRGYNNNDRAWGSEASIGLVVGSTKVPDGTYFYLIDLGDGSPPRKGFVTVHR